MKNTPKLEQLVSAIEDAMRDWLDNHEDFRPHNPAICWDGRAFEYTSALHGGLVIIDLQFEEFWGFNPGNKRELKKHARWMADAFFEDALRKIEDSADDGDAE